MQSHEEEAESLQEEEQDAKFLETYLRELVAQMPPMRRKVFMMSRFQYKTNREIAQELNISEKTVEVHITLAIKQLRERLYD